MWTVNLPTSCPTLEPEPHRWGVDIVLQLLLSVATDLAAGWLGNCLRWLWRARLMTLRTGHGNGAGTPRIEVLPANELPRAQAAGADPIAAGRDAAGKLRTSEAARALAKLPRRSRFVPRSLVCDPKFEPHNRRRLEWQRARLVELATAHGACSRGVGAMVSSAAWLYAAGEFASERAAETGDVELFKSAASLTGTARQHELAAWELAAREAQARPRESARDRIAREMIAARGEEKP